MSNSLGVTLEMSCGVSCATSIITCERLIVGLDSESIHDTCPLEMWHQ
jgi:hypothetical protein